MVLLLDTLYLDTLNTDFRSKWIRVPSMDSVYGSNQNVDIVTGTQGEGGVRAQHHQSHTSVDSGFCDTESVCDEYPFQPLPSTKNHFKTFTSSSTSFRKKLLRRCKSLSSKVTEQMNSNPSKGDCKGDEEQNFEHFQDYTMPSEFDTPIPSQVVTQEPDMRQSENYFEKKVKSVKSLSKKIKNISLPHLGNIDKITDRTTSVLRGMSDFSSPQYSDSQYMDTNLWVINEEEGDQTENEEEEHVEDTDESEPSLQEGYSPYNDPDSSCYQQYPTGLQASSNQCGAEGYSPYDDISSSCYGQNYGPQNLENTQDNSTSESELESSEDFDESSDEESSNESFNESLDGNNGGQECEIIDESTACEKNFDDGNNGGKESAIIDETKSCEKNFDDAQGLHSEEKSSDSQDDWFMRPSKPRMSFEEYCQIPPSSDSSSDGSQKDLVEHSRFTMSFEEYVQSKVKNKKCQQSSKDHLSTETEAMAAEEFAEQPKVEKIINTEVFDSDCTGGAKSKTTKPSESQSSWRKSKKRKVTEDDMFGDSDDDMEGNNNPGGSGDTKFNPNPSLTCDMCKSLNVPSSSNDNFIYLDDDEIRKVGLSENIVVSVLCRTHFFKLVTGQRNNNKKCGNPFKMEKHNTSERLQEVTYSDLVDIRMYLNDQFPIWGKICRYCKPKLKQNILDAQTAAALQSSEEMDTSMPNTQTSSSNYSANSQNKEDIDFDTVNECFEKLGISPIKENKRDDKEALKKKAESAAEAFRRKLNISPEKEPVPPKKSDESVMIENMKKFCEGKKFDQCTHIYTMIPQDWTLARICSEFNLTSRHARAIKDMQKNQVYERQRKMRSDATPKVVIELAQKFFQQADVSRTLGGK